MLIEAYIEALLVDEELADMVAEALEEYQRRVSSCKAAGGVMVTQSQATGIKRKFNRLDYLFAKCN